MSLTAGALSKVSVGSTTASLLSAVATSGTSPYTYQWYRSVTSGFTPGVGNIITGATALTLNDTALIPGTQYYYEVVVTDSAGSPATNGSAQLSVLTLGPSLSQNQFSLVPLLGKLDLPYNHETISVQVDTSASNVVVPGQAVKVVNSLGGIPKVIACSANTDEVFGFVNYDIKSQSFNVGDKLEISQSGNVMFLYATGTIARGVQVTLDITTVGGVAQAVGSSGAKIVGYAIDGGTIGTLIRVKLRSPSFTVA